MQRHSVLTRDVDALLRHQARMKTCIVSAAILSLSLLWACSPAAGGTDNALSQSASAVQSPFDQDRMDALLSNAVKTGEVIGVSALVFDEGAVVYRGAYGLGDRERATPVMLDTVWRIYSMTKPMTSVLIMDLVEDGLIALDDPVSNYIPEVEQMRVAERAADGSVSLVPPKRPMTIQDLLLHTSGLGYGIFGPISPLENMYVEADLFNLQAGPDGPQETMAAKIEKVVNIPLLGHPGEQWFYSLSIDVLGVIIERVTDMSLADAFDERLFDPLGMNETGFQVRPDQKARFVSNYTQTEDGTFTLVEDGQTSPFLNDPVFMSGGGGRGSTLDDVAKFAQMMLDGGIYEGTRILETDTVALMMRPHTDPDIPYLLPWIGNDTGALFGYGGSVQVNPSEDLQKRRGRYPGQWGWGGAARTNFYVDPQNNAFGIIMLQFFSKDDPALHGAFQSLALEQTKGG